MKKKEKIRLILGSALLSMLIEVSTFPKPLNVDRFTALKNVKFENFLATTSYVSISYLDAILDGLKNRQNIGKRIYEATSAMLKFQSGKNTSLGTIMLLIPLITATAKSLQYKDEVTVEDVKENVKSILNSTTYIDSIWICKAILENRPSWLIKVDKYDILKEDWEDEIKKDNANVKMLMRNSQNFDWIAYEYCNDYSLTFNENYPFFKKALENYNNLNSSALKTFIWMLSRRIDSHIYRKFGYNIAETVRKNAEHYYKRIEKGEDVITVAAEFKETYLQSNINAGTTADLLAAVLFLSFVTFLKI